MDPTAITSDQLWSLLIYGVAVIVAFPFLMSILPSTGETASEEETIGDGK